MKRGWCPGALTPMETGDGLLVRVRPRGGRYTLAQLTAIAAASRNGNGAIDLTNRANLQLRGLTAETLPHAVAVLTDAGLIDASCEIEKVRNVIVSPLAGDAAFDFARGLEAALARSPALTELPGKFGFAVDTADAPLPARARADIRITLDGPRAVLRAAWITVLPVDLAVAVPAALGLAQAFLAVSGSLASGHPMPVTEPAPSAGLTGPATAPIAFGVGLPYGRISGDALARLAEAATRSGIRHAHPSVQRCLVFPLTGNDYAPLLAAARDAGLILAADDPRLAIDACPGSPACARATTSTRTQADAIAAVLRTLPFPLPRIHVSGCLKGCAHAGPAALTIVAREGCYDLVHNGRADDRPAVTGIAPAALPGAVLHHLRTSRV